MLVYSHNDGRVLAVSRQPWGRPGPEVGHFLVQSSLLESAAAPLEMEVWPRVSPAHSDSTHMHYNVTKASNM